MAHSFIQTAQQTAVCKCCGGPARLRYVADFNRSCEEKHRVRVFPYSGIPVYYHRCPTCSFIFTNAFDGFTHEQFKRLIYNDQYILVDPEFATVRPEGNAKNLQSILGDAFPSLSVLDYGCGNGKFGRRLGDLGCRDVYDYDPFVPEFSQRPQRKFDCIVCVEVFEHSTDPRRTLADIVSLLKDSGILIFTTLLQPDLLETVGAEWWWYVAPRNGHVSIHSRQSLDVLADSFGLKVVSQTNWIHAMHSQSASFSSQWQVKLV